MYFSCIDVLNWSQNLAIALFLLKNFGNSSFGSFTLTCGVESSDEEEPCETIEEFEILNFSNHLRKAYNVFLPR